MLVRRFALALVMVCTCLTAAQAQTTNYWVDNSGYSGSFNDSSGASHWDTTPGGGGGGAMPASSNTVVFHNGQTTQYTVSFISNTQSGVFHVLSDNVLFDLSGIRYTARFFDPINGTFNYSDGSRIGVGAGNTGTVVVSSSVAAGSTNNNLLNSFVGNEFTYFALLVGNGAGAVGNLIIDDSLGFGATVWHRGNLFVGEGNNGGKGYMTVSGAGSEFKSDYGGEANIAGNSVLTVTNHGKFTVSQLQRTGISPGITTVNIGSTGLVTTTTTQMGVHDPVVVNINSGGKWNAGNVEMGLFHFYTPAPIQVQMTIDGEGSAFNANNIRVGTYIAGQAGNALVTVQNNGTLSAINTLMVTNLTTGGIAKNTVSLDNGNVLLGGPSSTNGGLFEVHGILRGTGNIAAAPGNAGNMTLRVTTSEAELRPGDTTTNAAIGMLSITDGDLITENGATSFFDFDATASGVADFISISNGVATLGGTLDFDAIGAPNPNVYSRWEFVLADEIIYTATDNIATLMAGFGIAPNRYFYGVVDHGFQQMLILEIPEPSTTALLLAACGVWTMRRRRHSAK